MITTKQIQQDRSYYKTGKEKILNSGTRLFALFKQYVAAPIERIAIGDLRKFDYGQFLISEYDQKKGFGIHSFGLCGNIATWTPKTEVELAAALNQIDTQTKARSPYRFAQILANSSPLFFSDTGPSALIHRKEVVRFMGRDRYVGPALQAWQNRTKNGRFANFKEMAMQAIAKGLLGIELSPIEVIEFQSLGKDFKHWASSIPYNLLRFIPIFKEHQKKYELFMEELLSKQMQKGVPEDSLLGQEIANKLAQNPNEKNLHKDADLKSLLLILIAVDNLDIVLGRIGPILQGYADQDFPEMEALEREIEQSNVADEGSLDASIFMNKEKMPHLDALYKKALVDSFEAVPIVLRYVTNQIQCGDHTVPARTYLQILSPENRPSPFSEGRRSCPGRFVAETVAKTLIFCSIQDRYFRKEKRSDEILPKGRRIIPRSRTTANLDLDYL